MDGNPMTAWTPRERALRAALEKVNDELCVTSPLAISRGVAQAFSIINAALADPPPPDPRDAALRLAEDFLAGLKLDMPEKIDERLEYREFQFDDVDIQQIDDILTAIRAAKGGE